MDTNSEQLSDERRLELTDLMQRVNEFYQGQLRVHPDREKTIEYLKGRGLSGEVAHRFELGFAPEGWNNLTDFLSNPELKSDLLLAGMLTENDSNKIYDRFRDRVMFPIRGQDGTVIGFGGRVLGDEKPKYLNSPETPLFHKGRELYGLYSGKDAIKSAGKAIVVEGYMDVVALAQANIANSVATLGTATTEDHMALLSKHTNTIVFCFDGDRAGRAAAWKALETSIPKITDQTKLQFLLLPDGEDPDTLVKKIGTEAFSKLIDEAPSAADFIISTASAKYNTSRIDGWAAFCKFVKDIIVQGPDSLKEQILEALPEDFSNIEIFEELLFSEEAQEHAAPEKETKRKNINAAPRRLEPMTHIRRAISLALQHPAEAKKAFAGKIDNINMPGAKVLKSLVAKIEATESPSIHFLLDEFMDSRHFPVLVKLSEHDHYLQEADISSVLESTLTCLVEQNASDRLDSLLEKAGSNDLDSNEKLELKNLLHTG